MAEIKYSNFISNIGKETDKLDHLYLAMDRGAWRSMGSQKELPPHFQATKQQICALL